MTTPTEDKNKIDAFGFSKVGCDLCAHLQENGQILMRAQNGGRIGLTHMNLFLVAPELLKVAKALLRLHYDQGTASLDGLNAVNDAEEAIAKAEGKRNH